MTVSLVTCVTNAGGMGPGHSCIDINGTIYSFEGLDYGGNNSGCRRHVHLQRPMHGRHLARATTKRGRLMARAAAPGGAYNSDICPRAVRGATNAVLSHPWR